MNNQIVKLGIRLFLFCLFAAVALGITNEVTKGPIAEQALASKMAALKKVMPGSNYEELTYEELPEGSELDELFVAKNENGEIDGYALTASPQGYGGEIPITIGVSKEGYVTQVYVGSLQETAGLGSRVGEAEFMDQFIGIPASSTTLRDDVNIISGASISSGAFLRAANDALSYTENTLGISPNRGDKDAILKAYQNANGSGEDEAAEPQITTNTYAVTGFADFNVEVSVDQDGKIVSVTVPENNETPGLGADLIADKSVFDSLIGQDISTAQIDVRTGVTLTSAAINDALKKAAGGSEDNAISYDVTGFAPFKVEIAVDDNNKITSVRIPENNETPGLGADLLADTSVIEALIGQDISTAQIDVRSGVTLTSNAVNDALKQAANSLLPTSTPGDPYTVRGMNKFTLYIEVTDGKIVSVHAIDNNETPGLGADLLTDEALSILSGQQLSTAEVDVKAGVTLTSNAINSAISMAAAANGIERLVSDSSNDSSEIEHPSIDAESVSFEKDIDVTGMAPFTVNIKADQEGNILQVSVDKHNETPGLGADLISDETVLGALVGKRLSEAKIDVRSGVTLTSNAINEALVKAAEAFSSETEKQEESSEAAFFEKSVNVTGMAPFVVTIAADKNGTILSINVSEHNETPGLGADLIADEAVMGKLVGQSLSEAKIDVRSGVTLTSNAINDALKKASEEYLAFTNETAAPSGIDGIFEVTGMAPFKVHIKTDKDGLIEKVEITEHNETPGLGADLIADTNMLDALIGKNIKDAQIDIRAGVTLTSQAINEALKKASEEVQQ